MPYIRHLDWLGSARLSTTWSHTVQSKVAYAPFGETYNEAGASSNDRSFTGQDQDTAPHHHPRDSHHTRRQFTCAIFIP